MTIAPLMLGVGIIGALAVTALVANFFGFRRGYRVATQRVSQAMYAALEDALDGPLDDETSYTAPSRPTWPPTAASWTVQ